MQKIQVNKSAGTAACPASPCKMHVASPVPFSNPTPCTGACLHPQPWGTQSQQTMLGTYPGFTGLEEGKKRLIKRCYGELKEGFFYLYSINLHQALKSQQPPRPCTDSRTPQHQGMAALYGGMPKVGAKQPQTSGLPPLKQGVVLKAFGVGLGS